MPKKGKSAEQNRLDNLNVDGSGDDVDKEKMKQALLRSYGREGHTEKKKQRIRERLAGLGHTVASH